MTGRDHAFDVEPLETHFWVAAVALIRESFPPDLLKYMTYGQSGIAEYLASGRRRTDGLRAPEALMVRGGSGELLAFAEFTFTDECTAHLAYVAVAPDARGRGLAARLMDHFISCTSELGQIELDVFAENVVARRLYERFGFAEVGGAHWRTRQISSPSARTVTFKGLAESLVDHEAFGFSRFQALTSRGWVTVGRLGDSVIRLSSPEDFDDDELLAALRARFSTSDEALLIDDGTNLLPTSPHRVMAATKRLRLNLPRWVEQGTHRREKLTKR